MRLHMPADSTVDPRATPGVARRGTPAPNGPEPYLHTVRVYWEDTDAGGVVFYANYLKFFERARTEWLRAFGVGQQRLADETGAVFVVTDTALRYRLPARLDDQLQITVQPLEVSRARLRVRQTALRDGVLLTEGDITIACVDRGTFRPRRIPKEIFDCLT